MEEINLRERVKELENRVSFLEAELDVSLAEERFKNTVTNTFPDDADVTFENGHYGYFARVSDIDGDDVEIARGRLEQREVGFAITETGDGLGMEVWDESHPRF